MSFGFGDRSRKNLVGVNPRMILVAERAIEIGEQDFFVNEGVRSVARQKELYAQGRTKPGPKVTWTLNSNHFVNPATGFGHAIDVYPFPFKNVDSKAYAAKQKVVAQAMLKAAAELNTPIRWGADWDMDGNYGERGESDSPHFELWGAC